MFEKFFKFGGKNAEVMAQEPEQKQQIEQPQLLRIFSDLQNSPEIFNLVAEQIQEEAPDRFASQEDVKKIFFEIGKEKEKGPLFVAKLIESTLGEGTLRKLAYVILLLFYIVNTYDIIYIL